ncbi:MAG: FdtA/QdtA family cupin domain-containing protein [Hymenobacteraceae bacterium]|nr:FdtA/QdtA family cupin domain-containing protein [Hymenobacteraceae bacterium]MDX5397474.1 FdtA/QdtA family cupin domain-containing protein [Hymenobacteraceae bacterium]MDX5443486.1 FdtA/QdtA family cupin domain-containing protein [Hymenobacteraceae bacterium]MDX5513550.1 FdtA/QdtA family cupin domain-containing protein [Hymenobacteraceae bacterium]
MIRPHLIEFPKLGAPDIGYISVAENEKLIPFEVKRTFWTYYTPESIVRGRHAHYKTEQILIAAAGRIVVNIEMPDGEILVFPLEKPNQGVYVPPNAWHTMQYSHSAVQLVLASTLYQEEDYIRDYDTFKKVWNK